MSNHSKELSLAGMTILKSKQMRQAFIVCVCVLHCTVLCRMQSLVDGKCGQYVICSASQLHKRTRIMQLSIAGARRPMMML